MCGRGCKMVSICGESTLTPFHVPKREGPCKWRVQFIDIGLREIKVALFQDVTLHDRCRTFLSATRLQKLA